MTYTVKWSGKFKKSYKLAKKRGLNISLLEDIVDRLVMADHWKKRITTMS